MDSKHYNALVSPDAYGYLDGTPDEDLLKDSMLEEQESEGVPYDDCDDESEESGEINEDVDDSDQYSHDSLFDEDLYKPVDEDEELGDEVDEDVDINADDELEWPPVEPVNEPVNEPVSEPVKEPVDQPVHFESSVFLRECNDDIHHIISILPTGDRVAEMLQNMEIEQQNELAGVIKGATRSFRIDGKDKMFIIPNEDVSVAILSKTFDPMKLLQRLENIGAVMLAHDKTNWTALMLYIAEDGTIHEAETKVVNRETFNDWQWKTVGQMAQRLRSMKGFH